MKKLILIGVLFLAGCCQTFTTSDILPNYNGQVVKSRATGRTVAYYDNKDYPQKYAMYIIKMKDGTIEEWYRQEIKPVQVELEP